MEGTPIARLSARAAKHFGLFTRADAHTCGFTDDQLRRMVHTGTVEALSRRVFRFTSSTRTWHQRVLAACLDGGPECLASHRTAAALHRLDGFDAITVVEVLLPMHVRHRRHDVVVHHTRDLPAADRCRVGVIPTTSVARTLIDLGAAVPATIVEEAFDSAERERLVGRHQVQARYDALRARGRTGLGAMTQVLPGRLATARVPRSVLERRMLRLLERAGLPIPITRFKVKLPDGRIAELDFAYVAQKLGIEVDGHGSHATRRQRASDNARSNALEDLGWSIRRFTYEQVLHESVAVASSVRAALASSGKRF
jgi:very-short-patch-repair endonuclease